MTVGEAGSTKGKLLIVEAAASEEDVQVKQSLTGFIHPDLRTGADVAGSTPLAANDELCCVGVKLFGQGFVVDPSEASALGLGRDPRLSAHIRPYKIGRDVTQHPRETLVIDLLGLEEHEVRNLFPAIYQWLLERVKPERDSNARDSYRNRWWLFGEPRKHFRPALRALSRYIVTPETSKHRFFTFFPAEVIAEGSLVMVASGDALILGVLSSQIHVTWALAAGGRLGIGNDPRYNKTRCFDPFPFPACSDEQAQRIRGLGEALDAHRKRQQALHPKLTLTGMYNVLEKLRAGEPLDAKERAIHEQGLVSILKSIHDDLDAAVFDAYGWPADLTDDEILERLVALNRERAEEERRGLVRWLRPDFQNPEGARPEVQVSLPGTAPAPAAEAKPARGRKAKPAWPKDLPARVVAVRDLLAETGGATAADVPKRFKGVKQEDAEKLLESLAAVGVAIETTAGPGTERTWRLLR